MKKLLVASTALVAVAAVSSAQAADPIKLSVGGFMHQWVGFSDNENDTTVADGKAMSTVGTWSNSEVYFRGSTKLDNGLTVGVTMDLESSGNDSQAAVDAGYTDGDFDDTFLSVSGDNLGTIRIGSTKGVSYGLSHSHGDVGMGLNDGDFTAFVANDLGLDLDTMTSSADGHKVVYLTPNFGGIQAGVSYGLVPQANAGSADKRATGNDIQYNAGIAYNGEISGISVGADINFEHIEDGGITGVNVDDENSVRGGLSIGVAGFTIAGSYQDVDNNDSEANADAKKWEAGIAYATGPYAVSFGYMNVKEDDRTTANATNAQDDESEVLMLSGSYDLGAGVTFSGSVFQLENDDASDNATFSDNDDDNWAVVAGLKVSF